jgi:AraC-like DNA-binding protein
VLRTPLRVASSTPYRTAYQAHIAEGYLTRWRLQVAARMLADGSAKVAAVAREVGYESEAAFSRAFERFSGVPPKDWRRKGLEAQPAAPE